MDCSIIKFMFGNYKTNSCSKALFSLREQSASPNVESPTANYISRISNVRYRLNETGLFH